MYVSSFRKLLTLGMVFLTGCATVIDQAQLKAPEPHAITFPTAFAYDTSKEVDLPKPETGAFRGVLAGTYMAAYEDDKGIYYRAPGQCVIIQTQPSTGLKYLGHGGIWIEKNALSPKFRLYRISGSPADPSPIRELKMCGQTAPSGAPSDRLDDLVDPIANIAVQSAPAGSSPASVGIGAGAGFALVAAIIEAEKGKLILLPQPVDGANISGAFSRQ